MLVGILILSMCWDPFLRSVDLTEERDLHLLLPLKTSSEVCRMWYWSEFCWKEIFQRVSKDFNKAPKNYWISLERNQVTLNISLKIPMMEQFRKSMQEERNLKRRISSYQFNGTDRFRKQRTINLSLCYFSFGEKKIAINLLEHSADQDQETNLSNSISLLNTNLPMPCKNCNNRKRKIFLFPLGMVN